MRMYLDEQTIGASRDGGFRHRGNIRPVTGSMAGIDHHGQMRGLARSTGMALRSRVLRVAFSNVRMPRIMFEDSAASRQRIHLQITPLVMPLPAKKPATTPIPLQLLESAFDQFILPHLSMPRRGPR